MLGCTNGSFSLDNLEEMDIFRLIWILETWNKVCRAEVLLSPTACMCKALRGCVSRLPTFMQIKNPWGAEPMLVRLFDAVVDSECVATLPFFFWQAEVCILDSELC